MIRRDFPSFLMTKKKVVSSKIGTTNHSDMFDINIEGCEFAYNLSSYNYVGGIKDKKGNKYNVYASIDELDSGRIAGCVYDYKVVIIYKNKPIYLNGHTGIFTCSYGINIINDIKDGYYLEDYLQKNKQFCRSIGIVDEIIKDNEYEPRSFVQIKKDNFFDKYERIGLTIQLFPTEMETAFICNYKDNICSLSKDVTKVIDEIITQYEFEIKDFRDVKLVISCQNYKSNVEFAKTKNNEIVFIDVKNFTKKATTSLDITIRNFAKATSKKFKKILKSKTYKDWKKTYQTLTIEKLSKFNDVIKKKEEMLQIWKENATKGKVIVVANKQTGKLRAIANDGIHEEHNAVLPKEFCIKDGDEYMVEYLVWSGKNYHIKGNIEKLN